MSFRDVLNRPLPSAANTVVTESVDEPEVPTPIEEPVRLPAVDEPEDMVNPELTPEEDREVDDLMNTVATPMLLADELKTESDYKEFVESVDYDIAIAEGFYTERTIVKFDKTARLAQLYEVALASIARAKRDRDYRKLETVYAMERRLKAKLRKKYGPQAEKKAKEYLQRAKKSKSGVLSKVASRITGK